MLDAHVRYRQPSPSTTPTQLADKKKGNSSSIRDLSLEPRAMVVPGSSGALNHMVGGLASLGHLQGQGQRQRQGQGANLDAELSQEEDDDSMQVLSSERLASSHRDRKRRRRRADVAQWTDPAVKMLIGVLRVLRHNLFEEEGEKVSSSQFRAIRGSNKQIWKSVAKALQAQGHNFDAGQCKTKFKGLKTEYHSTMEALGIVGVHSHVPESWEEMSNLGDEVREKIRKFKNFQDMRGYFMGLPVADEESFFNGEKPDEFLRNLDTFKDVHRQNHDSDKDENYLDRLLTLPIDQETIERDGRSVKRKSSDRIPPSDLSKHPAPVQSNSHPRWPMTGLADEGVSRGDICITQIPVSFEDPKKKEMSSQGIESSSSLERESRLREEYMAKKLMLKERKISLAEKNSDLEMLKAENEKHRLANETRKLDLEERRLKYQEDQLSSSSSTLTMLTTLFSQKFS